MLICDSTIEEIKDCSFLNCFSADGFSFNCWKYAQFIILSFTDFKTFAVL